MDSHLVSQSIERWTDSVNDCLKKTGLMLGMEGGWCMIGMNGDCGGNLWGIDTGISP